MKKKIFTGILTAVTALVMCFGFTACGATNIPSEFTGNAYVALDINPSVELVVRNGKVTSVRALNYDARVMLYDSNGIVGTSPEDAARVIAALALKYGYVTESNADIGLTVASDDEQTKAHVFGSVSAALTDEAGNSGYDIAVSDNAGATTAPGLGKFKKDYPDNAAIQALTPADYRIVKAAMKADKTLTIEEAVQTEFDDLAEIIEDSYAKYGETSDDKFELALKTAEYDYLAAERALVDPAYAAADPERGEEYAALRQAFLTLDRIEEIDGELAELFAITPDDLNIIAGTLGLDDAETEKFIATVSDGEGAVDEESIERYLDKSERNFKGSNEEAEAFDDLIEKIEDYLDEVENRAETLSDDLKAAAADALAVVNGYVGEIDAPATFDDVEDAAEILEERIDELEKYFDKHFTAEQWESVDAFKSSVADELATAKEAYDKAAGAAKTAMADALEAAQRLRLEIVA